MTGDFSPTKNQVSPQPHPAGCPGQGRVVDGREPREGALLDIKQENSGVFGDGAPTGQMGRPGHLLGCPTSCHPGRFPTASLVTSAGLPGHGPQNNSTSGSSAFLPLPHAQP